MERERPYRQIRTIVRAPRAWAAGGTAAVLAPLVALLFLSPAASAGTALSHTYTAPYKAAHVILASPVSASGCGGGVTIKSAFFNKTSGIGGFSSNVSTKWCSSHTNNSASYENRFTVNFPIHVSKTGVHNLTIFWITVAFGGVNLTAGTCAGNSGSLYSGCTRSASAFVYGYASLLDKNTLKTTKLTNKWAGNSTYVSNYTSCYYTSCSSTASRMSTSSLHTGSAYWAWYFNGTTLNSTNNYSLRMTIYGGAAVSMMTSGGATLSGGSADAQLNSATLGNEEDLFSITVG